MGLRAEIARIQDLNEQYRNEKGHELVSHIAHSQRHERLQDIKQELARLADLGRAIHSAGQIREHHRPDRPHLVKNSRAS